MANPFDDLLPDSPKQTDNAPGATGFDDLLPPKRASDVAKDMAKQFLAGIPRGIAQSVDMASYLTPPGLVSKGVKKVMGIPDPSAVELFNESPLNPGAAETTAGRYAGTVGEAVGGSVLPGGAVLGVGKTVARQGGQQAITAAMPFMERVVQGAVNQAAANPARFAAVEVASAGTGAASGEAAKDAGYGKVGQTIASIAGGSLPGVGVAYATRTPAIIGTQTGVTQSRKRVNDAVRDAKSFDDLDIRSFGPAFNQGPVASVGKQLTETPIIGAPLRNNLDETFQDMASARDRIAASISPNATHETAGVAVQRGLDRFRDRGLSELEPETIRQLGINPFSPVQQAQTGGRAQVARIQQGLPLLNQVTGGQVANSRGLPVPLPQTRAQKLNARTGVEDLSEAELQQVIRTPADQTSFSARLEALYEKANRSLPPLMQANGSRDPILLPTANVGAVVRDIIGDEARTGIRAGLQGRYGDMFRRLGNAQSNVPLQDLRAMRTAIGRELSNFGTYEASLDRTQLRRLYASLSSDIEVGMQDIAVRAAQATQATGSRRLTDEQALRAAQALRDTQVADRYARAGFERMDRFLQVVQAPNPQQAAQGLIRMASDGGQGNMKVIRSAMTPLRQEERSEFGALVVKELGKPVPSARGIVQEVGFSPQTFVTNYQKMSPEARDLFFSPQHQKAIDDLFNVANRIANVEALANTSRSGTNAINLAGGGAMIGHLATGDIATPLAIGGAGVFTSLLMSRPAYTKWMTKYMNLRANARDGSDASVAPLIRHLGALEKHSRLNPELWPVYYAVADEIEDKKTAKPKAKVTGEAVQRVSPDAWASWRRQ